MLGMDFYVPFYPSCGNPLLRETPYVLPGGFDIIARLLKSARDATHAHHLSYPDGFDIVQRSTGHYGLVKWIPLPRGIG